MSNRFPQKQLANSGRHSLREVLLAGMATDMKRARIDDGGGSADPEEDPNPNPEPEPALAEEEPEEPRLYAVTIPIPRVHVPPAYNPLPGHQVQDDAERPFLPYNNGWPAIPENRFQRFPPNEDALLDDVCQEMAAAMLTERGLYDALYTRVAAKIESSELLLPEYRDKILQGSDTFEALLCMNNALSQSGSGRDSYIDFLPDPPPDYQRRSERTYKLCIELRNLVDGLQEGRWHFSADIADMNGHVQDAAFQIDPRDAPLQPMFGAQQV